MNYKNVHRRTVIFSLVILFGKTQAQSGKPLFAGTKTPYPYSIEKNTPAPKGYKAVFINYVGRHGARFMTKSGADREAFEVLKLADKEQALTDTGRLIKRSVQNLFQIQQSGYEKITLLGMQEQKSIGARILQNYPTAFSGLGIQVQYTFKVRTQQSAESFLTAFQNIKVAVQVDKNADASNTVLRFYDLSPAYTKYKEGENIKRSLDSLQADPQEKEIVSRICQKLFKRAFGDQLIKDGSANRFIENLYDCYAAEFAIAGEMQQAGFTADSINFNRAFDQAALAWFDFKAGAADFLEKGPGRDTEGVQVKVAVPLLVDFLKTTDSTVRKKTADGRFRFTHAEAISPFATLLSIPLASVPAQRIFSYADHWKTEEIIPLSANIQWILYSNGQGFLVKVLLNEKEVTLPIHSASAPYYDWTAFKKFYTTKLKRLGVRSDTNMQGYLKTMK